MLGRQPEIGDVEEDQRPPGWISWSVIPHLLEACIENR